MSASSYWDRFAQRRVSRRRALSAAGALAIAGGAAALAGCAGTDPPRPVPTDVSNGGDGPDRLNPRTPPVRGGTLVTANSAAFGTWDPHAGLQVASAYFPRIYNLLLSQSPTRPEFRFMDLAEAVETPDDHTYTFKVRPGVKVAPNALGVPERDIEPEDVVATFERLRTDPLTNTYSFASKYVAGAAVTGPGLVTITLTQPFAWFVQRISGYNSAIPPRELLADLRKVEHGGAGGGPYSVVSVADNDVAKLVRNPNYYGRDAANGNEPLPYVDALEVRVIFDRASLRTAFLSGQTHQYWPQNGEEARGLGDFPLARDPVFAFISMTMNPHKGPFRDPRVRRAVSRAINRRQFVDVVYGGDARPNGLLHWPLGAFALPEDELASSLQPFDLADARALVEAAGGVRFRMMYPANTTIQEHSDHLQVFIEQMRAANIEVEQAPLEFTSWITAYHDLQYDCSLALNQLYETPELPLLFHATGGPFGDNTYIQGLDDADVDAAIARANTALPFDEQVEAVHEAQRVIYSKDPGFLPLVGPYLHMAFSPRLHNIPTGIGTASYSLSDFWLEAL